MLLAGGGPIGGPLTPSIGLAPLNSYERTFEDACGLLGECLVWQLGEGGRDGRALPDEHRLR